MNFVAVIMYMYIFAMAASTAFLLMYFFRSNRAIRVEATERVVIYALNRKIFSMDGNLLFSNDRLGTEYYTVSYRYGII